jgi:hypothetical protein
MWVLSWIVCMEFLRDGGNTQYTINECLIIKLVVWVCELLLTWWLAHQLALFVCLFDCLFFY